MWCRELKTHGRNCEAITMIGVDGCNGKAHIVSCGLAPSFDMNLEIYGVMYYVLTEYNQGFGCIMAHEQGEYCTSEVVYSE